MTKIYGIHVSRRERHLALATLTTFKGRRIKADSPDYLNSPARDAVERLQSVLTGNVTSERALRLVAGLDEALPCVCGREMVTRFDHGGPRICNDGRNCPSACAWVQDRMKVTSLKRYGTENPAQSTAVRDRMEATCLRNHGARVPWRSAGVQAKVRKTNMKRYGGPAPACSQEVRDRMEATNMARRGVGNCWQCPDAQTKMRATSMANWGTENPAASIAGRALVVQGCLDKFGATNFFGSALGKRMVKVGMMAKYGVEHALQHPEIFRRQQRSCYRYRVVPHDGRMVLVQGYEDTVLRYLAWRGVPSDQVHVSMEGTIPTIDYVRSGKTHKYHPDIMLGRNRIVEVKSIWTLLKSWESLRITQLKARATMVAGYEFRLLVVVRGRPGRTSCKRVLVLPPEWIDMRRRPLLRLVKQFMLG